MPYRLLLVLLFFFFTECLLAQTNYTPDFGIHSPDAYAFSKIDNIPMNNFTGQANLNLPLYEKKMSVLSFSMGLNYTGGGGLVINQTGSIVGKGWLLHTGGVIIRHTRGIPDDYQTTQTAADGTPFTTSNGILYNNGVTYKPDGTVMVDPRSDPTFNYSNGLADSQHDIFEFNIPGKSGKFYIGKDKQIVIVTDSKVQIIPNFTSSTEFKLGSFLIIDEAGIKYHFDQVEVTKEYSNSTVLALYYNKEYASSWLLTKIEAPFGEESITYQYLQTGAWVDPGGPGNGSYIKRSDLPSGNLGGGGGSGGGAKEVDIQSITFSDQTQINFNYFPNTAGPSLLVKSIDVLNPQQQVVKTYNLNYKQWESQNAFSYTNTLPGTFPYSNVGRWHHYLTSVDAVSSAGNHQAVYAFDYFLDQTLNEYNVPNGYDYWGYYNGKTNATPYMVPTQWGPAADRTPDANYAKLGLIKKIVYPTGGSEEFEYELNDKRGTSSNVTVAGLRIKKRTLHDGINPQNDIIKQYNYVETDGLSSGFLGETPQFNFVTNTYYADGGWPSNPRLEYSTSISFSSPANPLSSIDGSFAGYRRVEEVLQNSAGGNNGKIVYEYTDLSRTVNWDPVDYYPYRPVDRPYWAIGLPLITTYYSSTGAITKKIVNDYYIFEQQKTDDNYRSLYMSQDQQVNLDPVDGSGNFTGTLFTYRNYYPIVGHAELRATHEYDYPSITSTASKELLTQNTYDANTFMLRTSSQLNADGTTTTKYFYYPYDYNLGTSSFTSQFVTNNMINQPILTETWLNKPASNLLIQSSVTEYQLLSNNVVRPLKIYTSRLAQPLSGTPGTFSSTVLLPPDHNFQPVIKFNAYDDKSRLVEFENQGGVKSAIILDKSGNTLAKADNASFGNIAYSDFETDDMGNWTYTLSGISSSSSKSGTKSYSGSITKSNLTSGNYTVSLWASGSGSVTVNGVNQTINSTWSYYTWALTGITSVTINTNGNLVDQVGLCPQGAQMATANYYKGIAVESVTDVKGQNSYFEYDEYNRLLNVKDQNANIVKSYAYHYKLPFSSVSQSGSYTKDDCPANPQSPVVPGPPLTYTVSAGKYTSILSQADADAQALSDVLFGNGQLYANTNGTCENIYYNADLSVLFQRNDCTGTATGGKIYYDVPAKTYSSTVSQADADTQAQNDVTANGQNYANANCVCAPGITVTFTNSTSDLIGINFSTGINFQAGTGYFTSYTCPLGTSSIVLPAGTYTVSFATINSTAAHNCYVGGRTAINGTNVSFSNVNISNATNKEDNIGIY